MTTALYLSRARLRSRRGEALSAIAPLLLPDDANKTAGHAHRLVWLLFQDIPDTTRDFLWRAEDGGKFMILSRRPPTDPKGLFDLDTKSFEPALAVGDKLAFSLRANPTVARKDALPDEKRAQRQRGKRVDIVMDALHAIPKGERAAARDKLTGDATRRWLAEQGSRSGFTLDGALDVSGYSQIGVERRKGRPLGFSVLDIAGRIVITDPSAFLTRLPLGYGSAKAFGNGLMLIRRA